MLRTVKDLLGNPIAATDGEMGRVDAIFFDDRQWNVRYLVVDAYAPLLGRKVLISPDRIEPSAASASAVSVSLTQDEVKHGPGVDSERPMDALYEATKDREASRSHLRSSEEVIGYAVHGAEGLIGHVDDLLVDGDTWCVTCLLVDTGAPGRKMPLSCKSVQDIDWQTRAVRVELTGIP